MPFTMHMPDGSKFNLLDEIWKPLPEEIINILRQPEGRKIVREYTILEEIEPTLKRRQKFYKKRIKYLKKCRTALEEAEETPPEGNEEGSRLCITIDENNAGGIEAGKYSLEMIRHGYDRHLSNSKDVRAQQHLIRHIFNGNKEMFDEIFNKLKLSYGEKLEVMEETMEGFCIRDRSLPGDTPHRTYCGKDGEEQNYIKMAELLQERINMFNNLTAILF